MENNIHWRQGHRHRCPLTARPCKRTVPERHGESMNAFGFRHTASRGYTKLIVAAIIGLSPAALFAQTKPAPKPAPPAAHAAAPAAHTAAPAAGRGTAAPAAGRGTSAPAAGRGTAPAAGQGTSAPGASHSATSPGA